jgi:tetratricopeptide (TPR) repeat protein
MEHQYGNRIEGKSYRERGNQTSENWDVDMILCNFCQDLAQLKNDNESCYYIKKAIFLLKPWLRQINMVDEKMIDIVYTRLSENERILGASNFNLDDISKAIEHYDEAIFYAKHIVSGDTKREQLYEALINKGRSLKRKWQYEEAKSVYEEAYNLMAEIHCSNHPIV